MTATLIPSHMKALAKSILGSELSVRIGLRLRRRRALVLAWHNVVPHDAPVFGDRSLHLDFDVFRRQLDAFPPDLRVVSVASLLDDVDDDAPRCVLTFDDAYAGALTLAFPELASRGFAATMFVAPGLLGAPSPWWDAFADPQHGLSPDFRNGALDACRGEEQEVDQLASSRRMTRRVAPETHRLGTIDELRTASTLAGITLGSHSWSHPNFGKLPAHRFSEELERPLLWLREHYPQQTIPWFAWPYGMWTSAAERAAAGLYAGVFGLGGGWAPRVLAPAGIPRQNVPAGMGPAALRASIAGWIAR